MVPSRAFLAGQGFKGSGGNTDKARRLFRGLYRIQCPLTGNDTSSDNWHEAMIEKNDFYIDKVLQDDVLYFTILEPNLLMNIAPNVNYVIQAYLKENKYNYIVIDLSNVTRIDSAGYGMILSLITYFPRADKVNIFIINMSSAIKKLIELIGFPLVMYTYPSLESAVEKIRELKQA